MDDRRAQANIKKIPYGIADYEKIVDGNYYYVDKTLYLEKVEEAGDYLFFLRPRRFGKSLFLSLMETYYDVAKADKFAHYYRGTRVYDRPTAEKNAYLVLTFNFSAVEPVAHHVEGSFFTHVSIGADVFLNRYRERLNIRSDDEIAGILHSQSAADILQKIIGICDKNKQKLFVMVDEYDNFANTILSTAGSLEYERLTHGEGFFRTFFNVLKSGTTGSGSPISRLFLTGVSPLTMDDVTSGFNIGKNVSIDRQFNEMLGFTAEDVEEMIEYYRRAGLIRHETGYLLDILTEWYDHYIFSRRSETSVYNTDMVLYFLDEYFKGFEVPDELIDRNVRVDYGKLRHLITVDREKGRETNGNFTKLNEIVREGAVRANIVKGFSVKELTNRDNFVSLLFYLGLLTVSGQERDQLRLAIPNETVKRLYYEYIKEGYRETDLFHLDFHQFSNLMSDMAYEGRWQPLFEYIARLMRESSSLRDYIAAEKSIQTFLSVYLGLSNLYIVHTEKELNKGYADIVLEPFLARYEGIKYSYLLEVKYFKPGEGRAGIENLDKKIREAQQQLQRYGLDERFRRSLEKTSLVKLVLIFSGTDLQYLGEAKD
jgi:hypothetical protein